MTTEAKDPFPYSVWEYQWGGCPRFDRPCETLAEAKKHAAWMAFTKGLACGDKGAPTITCKRDTTGSDIPYNDYRFYNGESRKIS